MAEFNLAAELQRLAPTMQPGPEDPTQAYQSSMKTMGNMETDRQKHEELKQLFADMLEFKNKKASGQIPKDYSVPVETLQAWHKETAPSLSEQEFQNVIATFKDVVGGGNASQMPQDAPQDTSQPNTEPQGNPMKDNYVPSGSNMGDVLLAALTSMSRAPAEYNLGGKLQNAIESKQQMGLKKQEMAAQEREKAAALQVASQNATLAGLTKVEVKGPDGKKTLEWVRKGESPKQPLWNQSDEVTPYQEEMLGLRREGMAQLDAYRATAQQQAKLFHDDYVALREAQMAMQKGLRERLDTTSTKELSDMYTTYNRLGDVAKKAEAAQSKFGPISGRWEKLKVKYASDPGSQEIQNELASMITIAYALSGKQISEKEMTLLKEAMLPQIEQPYSNFSATLRTAQNWLANTHNDRVKYYADNGWDTSKIKLLTVSGQTTKSPTLQEFLIKAQAANPTAKVSDLTAYWNKKYGKK